MWGLIMNRILLSTNKRLKKLEAIKNNNKPKLFYINLFDNGFLFYQIKSELPSKYFIKNNVLQIVTESEA